MTKQEKDDTARTRNHFWVSFCLAIAGPSHVLAQGSGTSGLGANVGLILLTVIPFLFMTTTSFVKISVVFSILRNALGVGQVPSGTIIAALSAILTVYVMAPVGQEIYEKVEPELVKIDQSSMNNASNIALIKRVIDQGKEPLRQFMKRNTSPKELSLFTELARQALTKDALGQSQDAKTQSNTKKTDKKQKEESKAKKKTADEIDPYDFRILFPAFLITELAEAFKIGFFIFIPFLIIDLVISNILLALGMHMMNPVSISLPFKLLLFVLVDGWFVLARALVLGYA